MNNPIDARLKRIELIRFYLERYDNGTLTNRQLLTSVGNMLKWSDNKVMEQ